MREEKRQILIAEDDKPMAKALSLKLTKAGFQVKSVYNGEEAIEKRKILLLKLIMVRFR